MPLIKYIEVAISLPVHDTFTYSVPEIFQPYIEVGKRVLVPFGKRQVTGYITKLIEDCSHNLVKSIFDVLDEKTLFPLSMLPFFKWISDYYFYPLGEVIKCALPSGLNLYDSATIKITCSGRKALSERSGTPLEISILSELDNEFCGIKHISKKLKNNISMSLVRNMENCGWVILSREFKCPLAKPKVEKYVSLSNTDMRCFSDGLKGLKKRVFEVLDKIDEISVKNLNKQVSGASRILEALEKEKYIVIEKKNIYRDPFGEAIVSDFPPVLNEEQNDVCINIAGLLGKGYRTCLLAGVTGSGKTEVYMHLAKKALDHCYQVLVLVPEIALISQMEQCFRARFGDCIAVLHSRLSAGERFDQWMRIVEKKTPIVIGARSAVWAPVEKLGLIIVDEEHDSSYKQDGGLHYNARDLAVLRGKLNNCVVLLGSATPSLQSYYNVETKKYLKTALTKRVEKRPLPEVSIVDFREDNDVRGYKHIITLPLYNAINETLKRGEQVLLFLNRRGFSTSSICVSCGEPLKCTSCDISFTFHKKANLYVCHYCGKTISSAINCLKCGSSKIKLLGIGTEKMEILIKSLFPIAKVARMDSDTTKKKGALVKILKDVKHGNIDILIGTQIVAKGHDFANITLVGIICADLSLNFPDFRAGERTFQILAQVAGRAGRSLLPGKVILQTYNPEHFTIIAAKEQNFESFYNKEICFRKALRYPPFCRMIQLKIYGKDKVKTRHFAQATGDICAILQKSSKLFDNSVEILGPVKASIQKIAKNYRWQILIKGFSGKSLHEFVHRLYFGNRSLFNNKNVKVIVDVDPVFLM